MTNIIQLPTCYLVPFIRSFYSFISNFRCFEVLLSVFRLEKSFTDEMVDFDGSWKKRMKYAVGIDWKMKKMKSEECNGR